MYNRYSARPKSAEIGVHAVPANANSARKYGVLIISTLTVFTLMAFMAVSAKARSVPDSFADLVEKLSPAVVNISTTQTVKAPSGSLPQLPKGHPFEDFFKEFGNRDNGQERERKATSLGSGFVIDADGGYVITNNHVIDGADEIKVIFKDGEDLPATLVGTDPKTDLAVLKIDPTARPLIDVDWGDSDKSRVGDWVLAIGNPYGLGGTGTASALTQRSFRSPAVASGSALRFPPSLRCR